ncbi:MAG: hypothetical protein HRS57_01150 [Mycoplasmataceae bacterium]|nr:hypothetical protein [Mycoplasmataceae bacterium]
MDKLSKINEKLSEKVENLELKLEEEKADKKIIDMNSKKEIQSLKNDNQSIYNEYNKQLEELRSKKEDSSLTIEKELSNLKKEHKDTIESNKKNILELENKNIQLEKNLNKEIQNLKIEYNKLSDESARKVDEANDINKEYIEKLDNLKKELKLVKLEKVDLMENTVSRSSYDLLKEDIEELNSKINKENNNFVEFEKINKELEDDLEIKLNEISDLKSVNKKLSTEIKSLKSNLKKEKNVSSSNENELDKNSKKYAELELELKNLKEENKATLNKLKKANSLVDENEEIKSEVKELKEKNKEISKKLEASNLEVKKWTEKFDTSESEQIDAKSEFHGLKEALDTATKELSEVNLRNLELNEELFILKKELPLNNELSDANKSLTETSNNYKIEINRLKEKNKEILESKKEEINELKKEIILLNKNNKTNDLEKEIILIRDEKNNFESQFKLEKERTDVLEKELDEIKSKLNNYESGDKDSSSKANKFITDSKLMNLDGSSYINSVDELAAEYSNTITVIANLNRKLDHNQKLEFEIDSSLKHFVGEEAFSIDSPLDYLNVNVTSLDDENLETISDLIDEYHKAVATIEILRDKNHDFDSKINSKEKEIKEFENYKDKISSEEDLIMKQTQRLEEAIKKVKEFEKDKVGSFSQLDRKYKINNDNLNTDLLRKMSIDNDSYLTTKQILEWIEGK